MSFASYFDYSGDAATTGTQPDDAVFLPDLDDAGWERLLAYAQVSRFRQGETVIEAGAADRTLYIVADGVLELEGSEDDALVESGAVLGEVPFFDGLPHPVAIRARTDVDLLGLSPDAFDTLAARDPALARTVLMDLGRLLAVRLRRLSGTGGAA
ncbi:MAG: Crp/Fnr family transcriptional regulator [Dehalococcoidia bacterium]